MFTKIWSNPVIRYVLLGAVVLVLLFVAYFYLKGPSEDYFQEMLSGYLEKYKVEYQLKMDEKEKEIKEKDAMLQSLSKKLTASQSAYNKKVKELELLKGRVININEPKDINEIKTRLRSMGYTVK